ncbi:two-component system, NarL family, sensor histidine kinase DesK [Micromonospora phaseoli]|uniref:Two-component system, NarL family, sensor histidine kinase DesK n=1 Tax=Micromonospora phaseoli TaxID=1144548 RepID=A0A1H6YRV3_9ACTN|nr:two-component system sensor histidine kinase DesK [Micromonospora phaseoli]SEJ44011.1 two-component system, NarL family, sensor histidine kinase DesK [Micromonospora phaseoli]
MPGGGAALSRARAATLVSLACGMAATLLLPAVGLTREPDRWRLAAGTVGLVAFALVLAVALYAAVTPEPPGRLRLRLGYVGVTVLSVPLVAPVAVGAWPTWAWLGAAVVGGVPLLAPLRAAAPAAAGVAAVAAAVAAATGASVGRALLITGGVGLSVAAVNGFQVWFFRLLVQAGQGRAAQARLVAAQERLRFAGDVHDLLGHHLTVIALKSELAARLAADDPARAGREAGEAQRLAATALTELRRTVHGYRRVDLAEQLTAVGEVLRSSGVRCTVVPPAGELPSEAAIQLAAVLREAGTNVLRHSRAGWCRIEIIQEEHVARMTVTNDGVTAPALPDRHSHGLRGLADRLAGAGGQLRTRCADGVFTVEATVPTAA